MSSRKDKKSLSPYVYRMLIPRKFGMHNPKASSSHACQENSPCIYSHIRKSMGTRVKESLLIWRRVEHPKFNIHCMYRVHEIYVYGSSGNETRENDPCYSWHGTPHPLLCFSPFSRSYSSYPATPYRSVSPLSPPTPNSYSLVRKWSFSAFLSGIQ